MQNKKLSGLLLFIFFLAVYMLLGNGKLTTSMDIDVIRYAEELIESGDYGSVNKLASGVTYSVKTGLFYPLEGIGVVIPVVIAKYISKIVTQDSDYFLFMSGQILTALAMLFFYLILKAFVKPKRALIYTLIMGLATPILVHSKFLMPEPVTMLVFMSSIWCYIKYFYKQGSHYYLLAGGIIAGYSLLCRPDAPVFFLLFSLLTVIKLWQHEISAFFKKLPWFASGLLVLGVLFSINNFQKFGKIHEFGYTINKEEAKAALEADLKKLEPELQKIYNDASVLYAKDQNAADTQAKIEEFKKAQQLYESKKSYLADLVKDFSFVTFNKDNIVSTYFYGLYLILLNPNRSIFFLSPVLLFLLLPLPTLFKKYRTEAIMFGVMIGAYISVYALRAPLSYAGSAAWGIRYLLPTFMLAGLAFIGLEETPFYQKKEKILGKMLLGLGALSLIFQLLGSAVNYQSVQMPLEYACKQKFGEADMTWANESRGQLMTDASASLLINNWQILRGKVPQVLRSNLPAETVAMLENSDQLESGINDWLFYDVIVKKQTRIEGASTSKLGGLFFLLIIAAAGSLILLIKQKEA